MAPVKQKKKEKSVEYRITDTGLLSRSTANLRSKILSNRIMSTAFE